MYLPAKQSLILLLSCMFALSACAVMKKDNRVLLNGLDESLTDSFVTSSKTSKIVYAPLVAPVAIGAGVIDAVIITPARAIDPAINDTDQYLWDNPEGSDIRKAMLFLPKTVATPIVFFGSWTVRSLFTSDF